MDWIERLNGTMVYIEEYLTDDIDYEQIAKIACCSSYHYQRMFSYMAGVPLSEYIRRRRMTMAAVELQSGKEKVLDVALKYGYDSPTAFNRAFQKVHGITPSQAKESGIMVKALPPISFKITIKGEAEMNYRIEKKEAFRIIGVSTPLFKEVEKNFLNVPKFFNETAANGTIQKLAGMMKNEPMGILGVSRIFMGSVCSPNFRKRAASKRVPMIPWELYEIVAAALFCEQISDTIYKQSKIVYTIVS